MGVLILLAVVLLAAFGSVLAHSEPRLTGTNSVPLRAPVIGLQPGEQVCQPGQLLPAGSGRVRLFLAPGGGGSRARDAGRRIRQGGEAHRTRPLVR